MAVAADHLARFRRAVREIGDLTDQDVVDDMAARQIHRLLIEMVRLYLRGVDGRAR